MLTSKSQEEARQIIIQAKEQANHETDDLISQAQAKS